MSAYRWRQNPEGHARENVFFFLAEDENAGKVNQLNTKLINGMVMISGMKHLISAIGFICWIMDCCNLTNLPSSSLYE